MLLTTRNKARIVVLNKGKQRDFPTRQKGNNNEMDSLLHGKERIYRKAYACISRRNI
nr:MAG TPA: hypothetical protein [Caudoviricetes sp.]